MPVLSFSNHTQEESFDRLLRREENRINHVDHTI